jgi:hypothetical protein
VPFRNEHVEIIDRNGFLKTYEAHERQILEARKEFEENIDINAVMQEMVALCLLNEEIAVTDRLETRICT